MAQDLSASDTITHQLKFMNDAAHLLAMAAPASSSHIMSQRDNIMFANEMEVSEVHKRHVCGGCGAIKVPGWGLEVEKPTATTRSRRKARSKAAGKAVKESTTKPRDLGVIIDICTRCNRKTRHSILKPTPQRIHKSNQLATRPSLANASIPPSSTAFDAREPTAPTSTSTNTAKKKRSKAKQGGLQALLAKNKEAQSSSKGFGLDLMDLMK